MYISVDNYLRIKNALPEELHLNENREYYYCKTKTKCMTYAYLYYKVDNKWLKTARTAIKKFALFEILKNNNVSISANKSLKKFDTVEILNAQQ